MRITDRGLEYEAHPRHVELMVESLGLKDGKSVVSPGVENPDPMIETLDKVDELGETAAGTELGNTATQIGESGETTTGQTNGVRRNRGADQQLGDRHKWRQAKMRGKKIYPMTGKKYLKPLFEFECWHNHCKGDL